MSAVSRPRELDDPAWLRDRYERDGDMTIALELGVTRKTVRLARQRLGIASLPPGRRVTLRAVPSTQNSRDEAVRLIADRFAEDHAAPNEQLLATRLVNLHHARGRNGDYRQALIDLGSACALLLDRQLRRM